MKELKFTLYDVFGYMLPGLVGVLGLIFAYCVHRWHYFSFDELTGLTSNELVLLGIASYCMGHTMQALGRGYENVPALEICAVREGRRWQPLSKRKSTRYAVQAISWCAAVDDRHEINTFLEDSILEKFYEVYAARFQMKIDLCRKSRQIYELCNEALLWERCWEEHEAHYYREGFYRGSFIALGFLCLSLLISFIRTYSVEIVVHHHRIFLAGFYRWVTVAVFAVLTLLSIRRFRKFRRLRITNCFLRFIASTTASEQGDRAPEQNSDEAKQTPVDPSPQKAKGQAASL